jgi:hypothetical protein
MEHGILVNIFIDLVISLVSLIYIINIVIVMNITGLHR